MGDLTVSAFSTESWRNSESRCARRMLSRRRSESVRAGVPMRMTESRRTRLVSCAAGRPHKNGPGHEAEADQQHANARGAQRARPRTNSTNVPTGTPVGPRGTVPRSDSVYAVPAMSRCTHG